MLWSPSLTVVVARQQYGRRHPLAQESRTRSSSLEHRSLITAFACRSLLSLEDESVLESDHTVVSECLESNNKSRVGGVVPRRTVCLPFTMFTHALAWLLAINRSRSERSTRIPAGLCASVLVLVLTTGSTSGPLSLNMRLKFEKE